MRVNHVTSVAHARRRHLDAEDAYDAAQYFIDDVKDPWQAGWYLKNN